LRDSGGLGRTLTALSSCDRHSNGGPVGATLAQRKPAKPPGTTNQQEDNSNNQSKYW